MMERKIFCAFCFGILCLSAGVVKSDITELAYYTQGGVLEDSPDYDWWYGCSPTSAGMMMGYYDIHGYDSLLYDNLVPGGVAELSNYGNPGALANQAIASSGHIADFYNDNTGDSDPYGDSGDDVAPPHHTFNSLADFMGTSQDAYDNSNGSTKFYFWSDGSPLYEEDSILGDGMYGIGEYVSYAGYGTANLYTQLTDNDFWNYGFSGGFTFDDYVAEINAGRVVMLHIDGHSMFGYGYDALADEIILHDTWSEGEHSMTWGESYNGRTLWGVTVLELTGGSLVPVPAAVLLGMIGLGTVGIKLRKFA